MLSMRILILLPVLVAAYGCSLFEGAPAAPSEADPQTALQEGAAESDSTQTVKIENLAEGRGKVPSDVEIVWQIPEEAVEGYVIRYGFDRTNLDQEIKVQAADIEKFEDKRFGYVYRYVLADVPPDKTLFISIAAFNGSSISLPSAIFEVESS